MGLTCLSNDVLLNIFKFMIPSECQNMQQTNLRINKIINCEFNIAIKYGHSKIHPCRRRCELFYLH